MSDRTSCSVSSVPGFTFSVKRLAPLASRAATRTAALVSLCQPLNVIASKKNDSGRRYFALHGDPPCASDHEAAMPTVGHPGTGSSREYRSRAGDTDALRGGGFPRRSPCIQGHDEQCPSHSAPAGTPRPKSSRKEEI